MGTNFYQAFCDRTSGSGFKLKEGKFRRTIRKKFLIMRMVKHWNRLPREETDATFLETFSFRWDRALSNLMWLKMSLLFAGRSWTR